MTTSASPSPARATGPRVGLAAVAAVCLAVVLGACGGSSTKTAAASTTTTVAGAGAGAGAGSTFTSCLTKHGIPAGSFHFGGFGHRPTGSGSTSTGGGAATGTRPTPSLPAGVTEQQFQAALKACGGGRGFGGGFGGGLGGAFGTSPQAVAYRSCLSEHGLKLPTAPRTSTGKPSTGATSSTTRPKGTGFDSATAKKALAACAALRPKTGTTTPTTTGASA